MWPRTDCREGCRLADGGLVVAAEQDHAIGIGEAQQQKHHQDLDGVRAAVDDVAWGVRTRKGGIAR